MKRLWLIISSLLILLFVVGTLSEGQTEAQGTIPPPATIVQGTIPPPVTNTPTAEPAANILLYTRYGHYIRLINTERAIHLYYPTANITESQALTGDELAQQLQGQDIFIMPAFTSTTPDEIIQIGAAFSVPLHNFLAQGGFVIVQADTGGMNSYQQGFLESAGLMTIDYEGIHGTDFPIILPEHPLVVGLDDTIAKVLDTRMYLIVEQDIQVPIATYRYGIEYAIVASRPIGDGQVILLGFDYRAYSNDTARLLANAITWSTNYPLPPTPTPTTIGATPPYPPYPTETPSNPYPDPTNPPTDVQTVETGGYQQLPLANGAFAFSFLILFVAAIMLGRRLIVVFIKRWFWE